MTRSRRAAEQERRGARDGGAAHGIAQALEGEGAFWPRRLRQRGVGERSLGGLGVGSTGVFGVMKGEALREGEARMVALMRLFALGRLHV